MSPSRNQLQNLSRMTGILSSNQKTSIFAHSLWEFFNYQLYCTIRDDDGEPNRYRIELPEIVDSKLLGDVRVCISLRRNARQEEGLMHELLHANLIPLGYPKFRIWEDPQSEKWPLAEGITNNADHLVMLPIYLSLGYSEDRFLGPTRPLSERERRVAEDLKGMAMDLCTPDGYLTHLSAYLQHHNISFEAIHVANAIVQKKIEKCDAT